MISCKQGERESARAFRSRIKTAALRAGGVFTDKALANVFMDGLQPRVAAMVNSVRKPDMTISQLQNLATDMWGAVGTESTGARAPATSGPSACRKTADSKRREANFVGHGVDDDSEDDIGLPPAVSYDSHASPHREVMYVHP